jgi:predicted nuclease of restriction endonuclease-like (RecB) superfamily
VDYTEVFGDIKERIQSERLRVTLAANVTMVLLYWDIGTVILNRQKQEGWGAKVIDRLSHDLKNAFPDMTGLSPRNLKYMRTFSESWPDREIVQRTVAQIPWGSNIALLDKLKDPEVRIWYAQKTLEYGWSRDIVILEREFVQRTVARISWCNNCAMPDNLKEPEEPNVGVAESIVEITCMCLKVVMV